MALALSATAGELPTRKAVKSLTTSLGPVTQLPIPRRIAYVLGSYRPLL